MQLLSNLAQMVKSSRGNEKKPVQPTLDPLPSISNLQVDESSEAVIPQPTRRRSLPDPQRLHAARSRRSGEADASDVATSLEEEAIAKFLGDAADEPNPGAADSDSMWHSADELDEPKPAKVVPTPMRKSAARVKTRLLTVGDQAGMPRRILEDNAAAVTSPRVSFPVGWLVVTEGEGRGECFALRAGVSQIGRDTGETVALDFGDLSISRTNHASIAYDPSDHLFYIGHGGKANIVRLNGKPVLSTEQLYDGDMILIGETSLRLAILCDRTFNWNGDTQADDALMTG